jgi:hypothetical protein
MAGISVSAVNTESRGLSYERTHGYSSYDSLYPLLVYSVYNEQRLHIIYKPHPSKTYSSSKSIRIRSLLQSFLLLNEQLLHIFGTSFE